MLRVLLLSCTCLAVFFCVFVFVRPGMWEAIFDSNPVTGPYRRGVILEQLLGTPMPSSTPTP